MSECVRTSFWGASTLPELKESCFVEYEAVLLAFCSSKGRRTVLVLGGSKGGVWRKCVIGVGEVSSFRALIMKEDGGVCT